MCPDTLDKME
jgi:hypothetical protein